MSFHEHSNRFTHDDDDTAETQIVALSEVDGDCQIESALEHVDGYPDVPDGSKGQLSDEDNAEEDSAEHEPGDYNSFGSFENLKQSYHIEGFSLFNIVIVQQGKGQNNETGHDHVVEGLEVFDFEHDRKKRFPESEPFFRAFFLLIGFDYCLSFGGIGVLEEFLSEVLQSRLDFFVELTLSLEQFDVFVRHTRQSLTN